MLSIPDFKSYLFFAYQILAYQIFSKSFRGGFSARNLKHNKIDMAICLVFHWNFVKVGTMSKIDIIVRVLRMGLLLAEILVGSVVTCLTYVEVPNSLSIRKSKLVKSHSDFPISSIPPVWGHVPGSSCVSLIRPCWTDFL